MDGLNQVMKFNGIEGELYFETLQPIEFTEDGKEQSDDKRIEWPCDVHDVVYYVLNICVFVVVSQKQQKF